MMSSRATCIVLVVALAALGACGDGNGADAGIDASALVCVSQAQCSDGVFCNGTEVCAPGEPGTSALGCRASDRPCTAAQTCDEDVEACVSICGLRTDADGDGADALECGGDDCDDADASRFPGAEERCDEGDDDCDARVDEGAACTDAGVDSGVDGGSDAGVDAGSDAGPPDSGAMSAGTCEACDTHADCQASTYCVSSIGGRVCAPACNPDIPNCPRGFTCVLDIGGGVDTTVCLPFGGGCCVDQDGDGYGQGVGCSGPDCDDADETIYPGAPELCNARDENCDGTSDEDPTPCATGFCRPSGGGFEVVTGGACVAGGCTGGSATSCGGYECDGDEIGAMCVASCAVGGFDDDSRCVASHHCDAGACVVDQANGTACSFDRDCTAAHCENGYCCAAGVCCGTAADCPGGGQVCQNSGTCQGTRDDVTCNANFRCLTNRVDDDSACDSGTVAINCGLYDPVSCTGASNQTAPTCPSSCSADGECVDSAHCDTSDCVRDRLQGQSCTRPQDCQNGLFCVDGVCCNAACDGSCEACNLPATPGACTPISGCSP